MWRGLIPMILMLAAALIGLAVLLFMSGIVAVLVLFDCVLRITDKRDATGGVDDDATNAALNRATIGTASNGR